MRVIGVLSTAALMLCALACGAANAATSTSSPPTTISPSKIADKTVRAAVTIGRIDTGSGAVYAAFIGDRAANVYAVDAGTGKLLWKAKADDFPVARLTGTPAFDRGRLYVPVASGEETAGAASTYECCRFRGSLVALNAATGAQIWKTYTIADDARPTTKSKAGTQLWGPSGAPIWSAPAIDPVRNAVYITTAPEWDGSLSGARVREGISWGKVKETAKQVTIEGDASAILPMMIAAALGRPHR